MSPALNGSSVIRHFEHSDVIEMCDGITFDFYMGLPHIRNTHVAPTLLYLTTCAKYHMWQSRVEIEHYSIAYFDRVTMFKAL